MQQLDANGNELEVRERLAKGQYHGEQLGVVQEWLRRRDATRAETASSKRDAREERTLAIAEDALSIAKDANRIASEDLAAARLNARWAMWAAIIASVAVMIATKDQIVALIISWLP